MPLLIIFTKAGDEGGEVSQSSPPACGQRHWTRRRHPSRAEPSAHPAVPECRAARKPPPARSRPSAMQPVRNRSGPCRRSSLAPALAPALALAACRVCCSKSILYVHRCTHNLTDGPLRPPTRLHACYRPSPPPPPPTLSRPLLPFPLPAPTPHPSLSHPPHPYS